MNHNLVNPAKVRALLEVRLRAMDIAMMITIIVAASMMVATAAARVGR